MRTHVWLCVVVALLSSTGASAPAVFQDTFERGAGKWGPYHRNEPRATASVVVDDTARGGSFLRVQCPGQRPLEGVNTPVSGIEDLALYTIRARVRGKGKLWGCVSSRNGWLYAKQTIALTSQWQTYTVPKLTGAGERTLSINFLTRQAHEATFEIDAVEVVKQPGPPAAHTAVGPVRIEAEDYALNVTYIKTDKTALAGRALSAPIYTGIANAPFPLTTRPAFVYVRLKPGTPADVYRLAARVGGYEHTLAVAKPATQQGWQWVRFDMPKPAAARGRLDVRVGQTKRGLPPALLDAVVIAARGDLTPDELAATPALTRDRPLVAAGRCATPPTIDGRADDACWAECVAVRDFTLLGRNAAPTQKTMAKLCYDAERLYVAFRCEEYVLQHAANQRHAFQQNKIQRDSEVWRDDSVVLIVAPKARGPYFDLFANARGAFEDARCMLPDIWQTRDTTWNGDIRAAGRLDDGFWEIEIAVAFESLATAPPKPGERWRLCLGRIEKNAREGSAWNPVVTGFHDADTLGALAFLPSVGGADAALPDRIAGGKNTAKLSRAKAARPLLADLVLAQTGRPKTRVRTTVAPGEHAPLTFDVSATGQAELSCDLFDAGSLTPLYLSPRLQRRVQASSAKLRVATRRDYSVFLNGERVAKGPSADGARVLDVPLQAGVNAFSFQVHSGRLAAAIELPGQRVVTDASWRFAPGEPAKFADAAFDDSKWAKARVFGRASGALGGEGASVVGGEGRGVVRRVVWFEKTYVWPTPDPAQHVPQNAAQHLTFSATGMRGRTLDGFKLFLAAPPEFEVIGCTGYYGVARDAKAEFLTSGPTKTRRHGKDVLVYTVAATKPLEHRPKVRILELFNVLVRYRGPTEPAKEYTFEYWSEAERGSITEGPQAFPVRVTPPLRGKQPKQLVLQLWGSFFGQMDDLAMKKATLATMRAVGFNNVVSGTKADTEIAAKYGITNTMGINFEPWMLDRRPYLREHPEHALLDANGERSKKFVCTTALLARGWDSVAAMLRELIEDREPHVVDWDFESSPFTGCLSCYCPRCLAVFRQHAGLAADTALAAEGLRETHASAWIDFMTTRNAQLGKKFCDVVNACGATFSMYSGYQSDETQRIYGVDWRKIGRLRAADYVGCGYGRYRELVDATVAALDGIPLVTGTILRPYDRNVCERVVPLTKARVLRRLADSTGGILVYDRLPLAGRSWYALAEVFRLAADHEEVFRHGATSPELAAVDRAAEPELAVKRAGDAALVMLMNSGRKPKVFRVRLDRDSVRAGWLYYADKPANLGKPIEITVPAGDAEAIVLKLR